MTRKILFVDDEQAILNSFKRLIGLEYNLDTALGPEEGLRLLEANGPYNVVVSDMRMPEMNGAEFLAIVRQNFPETIRIILSGHADIEETIAAVNQGFIYRFLTKPCPPEVLKPVIEEALEIYQLRFNEKEILEKTLNGTIKLLADVLSLARPGLFSHAVRVRDLALNIANRIGIENIWKVEVAALLSQIGCIAVPPEITEKRYQGDALTEEERTVFFKHLDAGRQLLTHIPRFEEIAEAVAYQNKYFNGGGHPVGGLERDQIPLTARILKVSIDYELQKSLGKPHKEAFAALNRKYSHYDPDILDTLKSLFEQGEQEFVIREIKAREIITGMVLAEGIRTRNNLLLVAERQRISHTMRMCILNFAENENIKEPIRILVNPK